MMIYYVMIRLCVGALCTFMHCDPNSISYSFSTHIIGCYRKVLGTDNTADDLVTTYPNLAEKIVLDQHPTAENGLYLYALKLTDQSFDPSTINPSYGKKGVVFMTCSIHSREFTPAETCTRFAEYMLQNYDVDPDIKWMLQCE